MFLTSLYIFVLACSSELSFEAAVSSGQVTGQAWCAGDSDEFQWITIDFGGERKISGKENTRSIVTHGVYDTGEPINELRIYESQSWCS